MRFDVRRASIDDDLRELFEQYGEQVVAMALALGSNQGTGLRTHPVAPTHAMSVVHANQDAAARWLLERRHLAERREAIGMIIKVALLVFIAVVRRRRLSGTEIPQCAANDLAPPRNADRQAFRSEAICGAAQALDRRAYPRLAQPLPKARQGLGEPQSQSARILAPRLNPPHAPKTLQSRLIFPDRLLRRR